MLKLLNKLPSTFQGVSLTPLGSFYGSFAFLSEDASRLWAISSYNGWGFVVAKGMVFAISVNGIQGSFYEMSESGTIVYSNDRRIAYKNIYEELLPEYRELQSLVTYRDRKYILKGRD